MKAIGFVGPSGSGKSHRATWVSREKGIDYLIDDGLLIHGNRVVAGKSAKREETKIASIRRALFTEEKHVKEVKKAISDNRPNAILILGTSDKMVEAIAQKLGIGPIKEIIRIEDVASSFEITQALSTRKEQGKHVIPVPTFEIKKDFSGYFLDPLQIFRRKGKVHFHAEGEKSVVRPTFSYLGKYSISDNAIYQLIQHVIVSVPGISKITKYRAYYQPEGMYVEVDLIIIYGAMVTNVLKQAQRKIRTNVEEHTALNIQSINLTAKSLDLEGII